ncbi:hypothetical protein G5I_02569 [Acromyrmex echinatior]|uniref:Uncharacterized protein n=1 Tax=Acromyrmex echinatior TaxID=103372 RepID=F4WAN1_ACREC|nr:hypothetical protein G5I_02569 [Acromyrmex echinatior]
MEKRCGCSLLVQRSFLDLRISARISDTGRPRRVSQADIETMIGKHYWANKKKTDEIQERLRYMHKLPGAFETNEGTVLQLRVDAIDAGDGSGGVAGHGPDCLSIANGAQAAHVTGTPNVYRMDRSVFQVLQERSPACQDCRCGKRPCAGHTSSSSCDTFFARNARVLELIRSVLQVMGSTFINLRLNLSWKGGKSKILAVPRSTNTGNKIICVLLLIKQNKVTKQYYATQTDVPEATEHIAAFPICFWYCLEW